MKEKSPMARIEALMSEQEAKFGDYAREWIGYGTCTDRADRPRAEAAIRAMYEAGGIKPPTRIVWCDSPLSMILTKLMIEKSSVAASVAASVGDSVGASVADSVWASVAASVRASVAASVGDSVGDSVWASVADSVAASVADSVADSVAASVRASVGASVADSVGASVADSVWASVRASVFGQHEASWLAFYRFFRDECGLVNHTAKLHGLWELSQSCGWILPFSDVCFASERHDVCTLDNRGVIHNETGPAIHYADGFSVYAWHGTRIPQHWIEGRATLDPAEVIRAENVEQRAAGAAIIGWPRMVSVLKRKIVDGDPDSDIGALIELTLPGLSEPGRFLQAVCPRNGTIVEGVPRQSDVDGLPITTAIAAQAWRDGIPASEYQHPLMRT